MNKILLVSHGTMAKGVWDAINMIIGESNNVLNVCLSKDKDSESFKRELTEIIESIPVEENLIVVADILGGSPYTSSLDILNSKGRLNESIVVSGMNLLLVLSLAMKQEILSKSDVWEVINESQKGNTIFSLAEDDASDDDEL